MSGDVWAEIRRLSMEIERLKSYDSIKGYVTAWTPAWTALTVVGSPTYAGVYVKVGDATFFIVGITAGGANTTASTAGTTFINNFPIAMAYGAICGAWDATNGASYGIGGGAPVDGTTNIFTPTWVATNHTIAIGGLVM